jgi:predicted transcriptional regulator
MKKDLVLTSVHLEKLDFALLKALAKKLDKSQSAVFRQALRELAERQGVTDVAE